MVVALFLGVAVFSAGSADTVDAVTTGENDADDDDAGAPDEDVADASNDDDAGSAARRCDENENAEGDQTLGVGCAVFVVVDVVVDVVVVVVKGCSPLICFFGIKEAESGSKHFLLARKISRPEISRGFCGRERGVVFRIDASNTASCSETEEES